MNFSVGLPRRGYVPKPKVVSLCGSTLGSARHEKTTLEGVALQAGLLRQLTDLDAAPSGRSFCFTTSESHRAVIAPLLDHSELPGAINLGSDSRSLALSYSRECVNKLNGEPGAVATGC